MRESIKEIINGDIELLSNLLFVHHKLFEFTNEEKLKELLRLKLIYREVNINGNIELKTINLFEETDKKFISDLREIFGFKKTNLRGKSSSSITVKLKIEKWKNENPEYSNEDILKTAKYYVENYHQISNGILQSLDNFIYTYTNDIYVSKLSSLIEEALEKEDEYGEFY